MSPSEQRGLYELYVLGMLEEPERSEIEAEIRSGKPEALRRLREAVENNALLFAAVPQVDPPKYLKQRVMAITGEPSSFPSRMVAWIALSACLVAALIYSGISRQGLDAALADTRAQLERTRQELERTESALDVRDAALDFLRQPETRLLRTSAPEAAKPMAKVFVNPGQGVLLVASALPSLDPGRVYQMWIVPKSGGPLPMGLFRPDSDGAAVHLKPGAVDLQRAAAVALSNEPQGGSSAPTTPPFLITPVGG